MFRRSRTQPRDCCHILGETVTEVRLGLLTLFSFEIFGLKIKIGLIPLMGGALIPNMDKIHWLKHILIALAGPLASFGLGILGFYLIGNWPLVSVLQHHGFYISTIVMSFLPKSPIKMINIFDSLVSVKSSDFMGQVLLLTGGLNLVVAVFNMLPIPGTDGSRILFSALETLFGKKIWTAYGVLAALCIPAIFIYFALN